MYTYSPHIVVSGTVTDDVTNKVTSRIFNVNWLMFSLFFYIKVTK